MKLMFTGPSMSMYMKLFLIIPTFLAMGFSMSYLGGVLSFPAFYRQFPETDAITVTGSVKEQRSKIQGVINACYTLGALFGSLSCIPLGNRLGRRRMTFVGGVITIVGIVLQASAFSLAQLAIGRIIIGVGIGQTSSTVPTWQSEITKAKDRGSNVVFSGLNIAAGQALASWVNFGFSHADTSQQWAWRVPSVIPGILSVIMVFSVFAFPESPRWLTLVNEGQKARQVLAITLQKSDNDNIVEQEFQAIKQVNDIMGESATLVGLVKGGSEKMLFRTLLALSVQGTGQLSGAGLISFYSKQLFATIGVSGTISSILGSTSLTFKVVCCFIPYLGIERLGRRRCFIISEAGMAVCMLALAISGSQVTDTNKAPAYVGAVFAYLFVFFLPFGFDGVNWLYCQELITTRYRATVSGLSGALHWLASLAVALTTPLGFAALAWKYYFVWAAVDIVSLPIAYFFFPETSSLTVEEIDRIFVEASSIWTVTSTAKKIRSHKQSHASENMSMGMEKDAEGKGDQSMVEKP